VRKAPVKNDRRDRESPPLTRRRFLGQASCAAVGTTALYNTVLNMGMFNVLACGAPEEYRGLVCLFFGGGIDSFNVLVPRGPAEHAEYAGARGDLALPADTLLPITPATPDGREYGLHPSVPQLQALFDQGHLAFVSNVGTLVEPTTLAQYNNGSASLPLGLFSHSDQALHWQTSLPDQRSAVGWGGRMSDILQPENCSQAISMNISLSGGNVFQTGNQTSFYTITENGAVNLTNYRGDWLEAQVFTQGIDGLLGLQYQHLFEKTYASRLRGAIDAGIAFAEATAAVPPLATVFSDTSLSRQLRMVALTIAAREALGMKRQTFFVEFGGWDHHDELLLNQEDMLPVVAAAMSEFYAALEELGVAQQVTTFTASDFGRTLSSNGQGSDHAWGGIHLAMGGAVRGGDLYGTFPDLYLGGQLDTGRGRLIPTTSVDEYFAELALWFGVSVADLPLVLPNIARFYTPGSAQPPVGFLGAPAVPSSARAPYGQAKGRAQKVGVRRR
jgi:uncharacterized protein (DUF1501 family)